MKKYLLIFALFITSIFLVSCNINEYTITFDTNGGSNINSITFTSSISLAEINEKKTTKDGFNFVSWHLDNTLSEESKLVSDIKESVTLYAKWEEVNTLFTITWVSEGVILKVDTLNYGDIPIYNGDTPIKEDTNTHTYSFSGWDKEIEVVSKDETYTAIFSEQLKDSREEIDYTRINVIFDFNIYDFIPKIYSNDYYIFNFSDKSNYDVEIVNIDWDLIDSVIYKYELDLLLPYDQVEEAWVINNVYIKVLELETINVKNPYKIVMYGSKLNEENDDFYQTWLDLINDVSIKLSIDSLEHLLDDINNLSDLTLYQISNKEVLINGNFSSNGVNILNDYIDDLLNKGFVLKDIISNIKSYSYYINDDLAYLMVFNLEENNLSINFSLYSPVVKEGNLNVLSNMKTINEYELSEFGMSGLPSVGKFNVLVIPVEIKGVNFPSDYYNKLDLVFNGSDLETGYQSVSSYYYKSSYSKLDITFDIANKVTTTNNKNYYESFADEGDQHVIVEALRALDDSIDYSIYDTNNDGLIDSVIFIYSVNYNYNLDPWWAWVYSAKYGYAYDLELLDGVKFEYYFWASYDFINDLLPGKNVVVNSETYIHELGHLMGMPDLYSYSNNYNYGPLGGFDMMDYNSGDHGPFNKLVYGWLEPLVATKGSYSVTLDSYSLDDDGLNNTLLIPYNNKDFLDGDAFDEYLLVIFYTPNGLYESHLGASHVLSEAAIIVYHIDARLNNNNYFWSEYFLNNNSGSSNHLVSILERDYNNSLPSNNNPISISDTLTSGTFDLRDYRWNQGGIIDVVIELDSLINNNSLTASINVSVN